MDILMTYWNSVWRSAVSAVERPSQSHTADEWAAYDRSLAKSNPSASLIHSKMSRHPLRPSASVVNLDLRRRAGR
jgi:hypothetical protein